MAKKKKANSVSSSHEKLRGVEQQSAIMISISDTSSRKNPSRNLIDENKRVLFVTEDDMKLFSVNRGEEVLVVEVESDESSVRIVRCPLSIEPKFMAICKIDTILPTDKNPATLSSPKVNNAKGRIVPRILPSEVSSKLFSSEAMDLIDTSLFDTIASPPKTSSTSDSFTFESFNTSPINFVKTNVRMTTPLKKSALTKQLAILSLKHCPRLYKLITTKPLRVYFRICHENPESFNSLKIMSKGLSTLCHIVQGLCQDQYFSIGDTVIASFQGKKIRLELFDAENVDVDEKPSEMVQNLIQNIDDMTLHSKSRSLVLDELMDNLVNQLVQSHRKRTLYYISFETKINIDFSNYHLTSHSNREAAVAQSIHSPRKQLVAGMDGVAAEILTVLLPTLYHPEQFPQNGSIRAPKGLLLHGTSGCGKSLLAIQLSLELKHQENQEKNVETGRLIRTRFIDCTSIQSATTVMGEAERKLSKIFEDADKAAYEEGASTLIILDDIHLICPRRGMAGETSSTERVASTLLALMDGITTRKSSEQKIPGNVVVLAITHDPSLLDPALRRAGRIDLEVEVPSPDDKAKCDIFRLCVQKMCNEDTFDANISNIEFMHLAKQAKGFTGADCALSIKEAMRIAIQRKYYENHRKIHLTLQDLQTAVRQTKPSAIKSVVVEIPRVPWSSIGGMEDVKKLLREAIELPLTHSHLFSALKISPPRGVLLYGPPGCSKTLMARALATEGNMNFLAVKGPELLSKWLGESERALASLFRRARLASPCVIFFDELDAIASSRGSGEGAGGERLLSQLLTELDGVTMAGGMKFDGETKSPTRVVVVGATNRPDLLDKALMRPGRIDRKIYVGLPDLHSRQDIFSIRLRGKTNAEMDFFELARISEGYSGAEIVSICREASLLAIEESDRNENKEIPIIKMDHVRRSLEGTKRQISKEMLQFYDNFAVTS